MNASEILRMVDSISRDKAIDKEIIFQGIEEALHTAARRRYDLEVPPIKINRENGEIIVLSDDVDIDVDELGRIAAQSAKQIIVQRIREAERDTLFDEFETRVGEIVSGAVLRYEGPHIIINLGRVEAILPRSEQVSGETFRVGDRVRAHVKDVEKKGQKVKIFVSRRSVDFVHSLFELEVPEIADGTVEIMAIAREHGYRTKVAVASTNEKVDALGACVGVRGSRIKNVVDELNGEKVDIIRWSDDFESLIKNALKPATIYGVALFEEEQRAEIYVIKDQLSLAIGKGGQNVRLASKMCGWEIDILEVVEEGEETEEPEAVETDEAVAVEETPEVDETPDSEETPEVDETPDSEETPEVDETPDSEETPEVDETPDPEETPEVVETNDADEIPVTEETAEEKA